MTAPAANAALNALRGRVRALELGAPGAAGALEAVSLGVAALDGALPWGGLPRGALHAIAAGGAGVPTTEAHDCFLAFCCCLGPIDECPAIRSVSARIARVRNGNSGS